MREILFRGKCIGTKEWVYGYFFAKPILEKYFIELGNEMWQVDPITVGQYTGLQDKNGKKIFEGDIVKYIPDDEDEVGVDFYLIEFYNGSYRIGRDVIAQDCADEWEVAGNVHDNSELLKDNK